MAERNIRLTIEYDGSAYSGWQLQTRERTIQGEVVAAVKKVTGQDINLIAAGRTDAGVHALGQIANFKIDHRLEAERFRDAVNYYLDDDIRILRSEEVPLDFNARFSARHKRYRYLIARERSALYRRRRWEGIHEFDLDLLRRAAALVEGEHDFAPFCVVSSRKPDNRCFIHRARWRQIGPLLVFEIRGNRFLHNMVRALVGSMVNLAAINPDNNKQNLTLDRFGDTLTCARDERIGFTAPAHGLYLVSVGYKQ